MLKGDWQMQKMVENAIGPNGKLDRLIEQVKRVADALEAKNAAEDERLDLGAADILNRVGLADLSTELREKHNK